MSILDITGNKKLSALCQQLDVSLVNHDATIHGLCCDTRKIRQGDLFCAYPGDAVDGRDYLLQAIEQGATAIFYEKEALTTLQQNYLNQSKVPTVAIQQLKNQLGQLASFFYDNPSKSMNIVATTGTNGKTTCSYLIATALSLYHHKAAMIGTIGVGFPPQLETNALTTPDAIQLHAWLAALKQQGAKTVALEASSHGLQQGRLNECDVDIAIFTNLTQDHLDYHGDMQHYAAAKRLLFTLPNLKTAILNADDHFGQQLWQTLPDSLKKYRYSAHPEALKDFNAKHDIVAREMNIVSAGILAQIDSPWGSGELLCPLWGEFNISNMLAVIACLSLLQIPFESILMILSQVPSVPGRLERFGGGAQPLVIVDFAHTPDALEKVLYCLKQYTKGRLICVFGCGGDRDSSKRAQMGRVVAKHSDFFIVTNDNPRSESPQRIADQILSGIGRHQSYEVELDRQKAITKAIQSATAEDIVLIAGKGHEQYQIIGDKKMHFSDQECIRSILKGI